MGVAIDIPEGWEDLESFARWYIDAGMPMMPPLNFETFVTDDATAICMFRKAPYQVELYIIDDALAVPNHEHPHVDVIQGIYDGSGSSEAAKLGYMKLNTLSDTLTFGESHGAQVADVRFSNGSGILYTFERWPDGVQPSTVSAVWKGCTVGPKHDALIKRFFPKAYLKDGYADTTRLADE